MRTTAIDVEKMPRDERLALYEAMFFCGQSEFGEFGALPLAHRRHILQDVLDDCDATSRDGIGMFSRVRLVEFLRQDERREVDKLHARLDRLEAACAGILRDYESRQVIAARPMPNGDC